ncbi:unnamed protein product, partial [Discosporangium mesarthrocarpum]
IQSGREVARFGQELWDRINGQNPHEDEVGGGSSGGALLGSVEKPKQLPEDSAVMVEMRGVEECLQERAMQTLREVEALQANARAKEVAWDTSERRRAHRAIREKEARLANAYRTLTLHRIDMDMERMCFIIEQAKK